MMRLPANLEFVDPPERGLPRDLSDRERDVVAALLGKPASDSKFVTLAEGCTHHQAETLRRRIHRGRGPWAGGAQAWCVVVRKVSAPPRPAEWAVYVRRADQAAEVAQ